MTQKLQTRQQVVWTIAGFDPSNGAGLTADLQVFSSYGLSSCSAATALTVQNTRGVRRVDPVAVELLRETLLYLGEDLFPAGIKIGMLGSGALARVVAEWLAGQARRPVVVLDPVLRSSSGRELFPVRDLAILLEELLPRVDWVTPNWGELEVLTGQAVRTEAEALEAARALQRRLPGLGVVATGGDQEAPVDLVVEAGGAVVRLEGRHIATRSTHGTGCAFSSAMLAELVLGAAPREAAAGAKAFVERALELAPGLGSGKGPMELLWPLLGGAAAAD